MTKAYFASDFHLGIGGVETSELRERRIVKWLNSIEQEVTHLFLVGDLFDFWYEYASVAPKGYVRLLGKLAALADNGVELHIFTGNHDLWMKDYLKKELGCQLHHEPIEVTLGEKRFLIGHGDGLGPGDHGYKLLKRIFVSPVSQWLFSRLHPNLAFALARFWSGKSRDQAPHKDRFEGRDGEWLVQYCEQILENDWFDYFIFGHRHLPIHCPLANKRSLYINLGDWIMHHSFAYFDGNELRLDFFESPQSEVLHL